MIRAEGLSLAYGKKMVLENATFHIEKGAFVALSGDNGSGKSTLLSAMAGALSPHGGILEIRGRVGYIPQGSGLMEELTFGDNLRFFAGLAGAKMPEELPFGAEKLLKTKVQDMSGGMKKLCSIVCGVVNDPEILLLDEPCASLDEEHKQMLLAYLGQCKAKGTTIVYVGHDHSEYEALANQHLLVSHGETEATPV